MSSYKQILYHIVFCTKHREPSLNLEYSEMLYKYIWGIIKRKNGVLYRINGMEDHIHILSDLDPSVALADYVRDIKRASSGWLAASSLFPNFKGWAEGYGAFSYTWRDKEIVLTTSVTNAYTINTLHLKKNTENFSMNSILKLMKNIF